MKSKIISSGLSLSIANILLQVLAVIFNIILARKLGSDSFGLIALSATFINFIVIFTRVGLGSSIIQKTDANQDQISTLYWIQYPICIFNYLVIFFLSPFAASFYNEPELSKIVRIASLTILMMPFYNTHYKLKEKNIEFDLLSKIEIGSYFIGYVFAIATAFSGFGVYSLVIQIVISFFIKMILTLFYSDWRPSFSFKFNEIKEMLLYSIKYKLSTDAWNVERNIDYLILGRLFSATTLGYYSFTYNIMYMPVKRITYLFNSILFPSFSQIKETNKIIKGYFRSVQLVSMISFPLMTLISFNASLIIPFVFGSKWVGAIPLVQILAFAGAFQSISLLGSVIFSSIGKPEVNIYIALIRSAMIVLAIFIGSFYGIIFISKLLVLSSFLSLLLMNFIIKKFINYSFLEYLSFIKGTLIIIFGLFILQFCFLSFNEQGNLIFLKLILMTSFSIILTFYFYFHILKEIYLVIRSKLDLS